MVHRLWEDSNAGRTLMLNDLDSRFGMNCFGGFVSIITKDNYHGRRTEGIDGGWYISSYECRVLKFGM